MRFLYDNSKLGRLVELVWHDESSFLFPDTNEQPIFDLREAVHGETFNDAKDSIMGLTLVLE